MVKEPFVLGFVGFTAPGETDNAAAYEDAVLPILEEHGARVLYRGRRADDEDATLPAEIHLIWFPDSAAFDAFLADDRRQAAISRFGNVFSRAHVVRLDTVAGNLTP